MEEQEKHGVKDKSGPKLQVYAIRYKMKLIRVSLEETTLFMVSN